MKLILPGLLMLSLSACTAAPSDSPVTVPPCSASDLSTIESKITSADRQGHGPDIGSDEWFSVIEFRLGLQDNPALPQRGSQQWCDFINSRI